MTIRDIAIAFGVEVDNSSVNQAKSAISNLKSFAVKALAAIGVGFSLTKIKALLEEWYSVNKVVNRLTTEYENQHDLQNKILETANSCRVAYKDMADYVSRLTRSGSAFFSNAEDAADFLEVANQAFKVSGASTSQMATLNNTLISTFTTGKLSASGFTSIMNTCPEAIEYLSKSLGISKQQVKALGLAGAITAKQLYNAFYNSSEGIREAYGNLSLTISDALTIIRNEWGTWLAQMDESLDLTNRIAKFMIRAFRQILAVAKSVVNMFDRLSKLLGSTRRAALLVAAAIGAITVAFKYDKIVAGIKAISSALAAGGGKVLLVVAAILLCIAVLDDLIAFANGDDSLIGSIFEKFGIDAEGFRQSLKQLFSLIVQMFNMVMPILQRLVSLLLPLLQKRMKMQFEILAKVAEIVIGFAVALLEMLMPILEILIDIIDQIITFLEPIIDLVMIIMDIVMELVSIVLELIKPLLSLLTACLQPIFEIVKLLAKMLSNNLSDAFAFVGSIVNGIINGSLKPLLDFLQQIIKFITAVFTGDWETAWKALGNIPIAIINGIIAGFESLINFFVNAINSVTKALSSLWTWIGIPAIPAIPNVSFGRISYLAQGGYIGKNQPTPVVIGDNKKEGEIVSPVSKMRDTVIDALTLFMRSAKANSQPSAQTLERQASNRSITQNVYMYNTFEGSAEVQKTTSKAMKQAGGDLTSELANAIAYTR